MIGPLRTSGCAALLAAVMTVAVVTPARPQSGRPSPSGEASLDPAQRKFVQDYVAALRAKDLARLQKLVHPKVRACMTAATREYFDLLFANDLRGAPSGQVKAVSVRPLPANPQPFGFPPEMFSYPLPPTHQVQIDFEAGPSRGVTIIRFIAALNGSWFDVLPCPTAQGVRWYREQVAAAERQQARARQLAADLKEPLLSELKGLLREQRKLDAVKRYQAASGVDQTTAFLVIEVIEGKKE